MKTLQVKHQGVDRELLARVEALGATLRPTPVVLEQVLAGEVGHQLGGDLEPMAYLGRVYSDRRLFSGGSDVARLMRVVKIHGSATTAATKTIPDALTIPNVMAAP